MVDSHGAVLGGPGPHRAKKSLTAMVRSTSKKWPAAQRPRKKGLDASAAFQYTPHVFNIGSIGLYGIISYSGFVEKSWPFPQKRFVEACPVHGEFSLGVIIRKERNQNQRAEPTVNIHQQEPTEINIEQPWATLINSDYHQSTWIYMNYDWYLSWKRVRGT